MFGWRRVSTGFQKGSAGLRSSSPGELGLRRFAKKKAGLAEQYATRESKPTRHSLAKDILFASTGNLHWAGTEKKQHFVAGHLRAENRESQLLAPMLSCSNFC